MDDWNNFLFWYLVVYIPFLNKPWVWRSFEVYEECNFFVYSPISFLGVDTLSHNDL